MATPVEAPEGITVKGTTYQINGAISKTEIEVLDLISEGPIEGLVESTFTFNGTLGNVGWDSYTETSYPNPPGTIGSKWLRSVFLNEVPIMDSANKYNYQRVDIAQTKGNPNGDLLIGSSLYELNISRAINERLRYSNLNDNGEINKDYTKFYRIYNKDCKGAILNVKIPRISATNSENGDIKTTFVDYKIYYRPFYTNINKNSSSAPAGQNGFFGPVQERIEGKLSSPYIRSTKIMFPEGPLLEPDFIGWELKVIRLTEDSTSVYLQNQTYVDSLTEIYTNVFCYPNVAVVRSRYDAEFFASVPQRAFDVKLLKVKVPANYDPIKKSYATSGPGTTNGTWDGTFADELKWTDNPAFVFYDLITNKRYGLGDYISENQIDKFTLYQIAKYCDTLVPDGYGGLEPRFTCNIILFTKEEAYKVLNDFASIFNAMVYYFNGSIYLSQDRVKEPVVIFNNSNVENGDFIYSGSSKKARNTIAIVRYNDPKNFFKPALEYVQDVDGIRKYGIRSVEVAAFGCTSRGQAYRLGRWMILSQLYETETVSFVGGSECSYLRPGDIFSVYDTNRKLYRNAGRLISVSHTATTSTVTLDGVLDLESGKTYYFNLLTPSYNYQSAEIENVTSGDESDIRKSFVQKLSFTSSDVSTNSNNQSVIAFSSRFDTANYVVKDELVWAVNQDESLDEVNSTSEFNRSLDKDYDYFRVVRVTEKENGRYEVAGVQYVERKFDEITESLTLERETSTVQYTPSTPLDLQLNTLSPTKNSKQIKYSIIPPNSSLGLSSYKVYTSTGSFTSTSVPDSSYLTQSIPAYANPAGDYFPSQSATYYFRVYGYNDESRIYSSSYVDKNITISDLNPIKDVIISSLTIDNSVNVPSTGSSPIDSIANDNISPTFSWQVGLNKSVPPPENLYYRVTFREPQISSPVPSSNIYYEITGLSNSYYQFLFDTNAALTNGPYKNYEVVVEAHDSRFYTSAGNIIGYGNVQRSENGWIDNPNGYDRVYVYGADSQQVTLAPANQSSFNNSIDSGKNYSFVDFNGGVVVLFSNNDVSSGIVGGFIYASTGIFTAQDARTGRLDIVRRQFKYNPEERYAMAPAVFNPYLPFSTGYMALSVYDSFEREKLLKNPSLFSGFSLSNVVDIYSTGFAHSIALRNKLDFINPTKLDDLVSVKINNVSSTGNYQLIANDSVHGNVIIMSRR